MVLSIVNLDRRVTPHCDRGAVTWGMLVLCRAAFVSPRGPVGLLAEELDGIGNLVCFQVLRWAGMQGRVRAGVGT